VDNSEQTVSYEQLFHEMTNINNLGDFLNINHTYMFELATPHNRITTKYDKSRLVILGARHFNTGNYVSLDVLTDLAKKMGIESPLINSTKILFGTQELSKESLYALTENWLVKQNSEVVGETPEGVVVYDPNGVPLVKIKSNEYLQSGKLGTKGISSVQIFIAMLEEKADDYQGTRWEGFLTRSRKWVNDTWEKIMIFQKESHEFKKLESKTAAKNYAMLIPQHDLKDISSILFRSREKMIECVYTEDEFATGLIDLVRNSKSSLNKMITNLNTDP